MASQALIWETLKEESVNFYTEKNGNGTMIDVSDEKNEIMKLINSHTIVPSFSTNITLSKEIENILHDDNNVLENFEIINDNENLEIYKDENDLHIKSNTIGDYFVTLRKIKYSNKSTFLYVGSDGISQKLMKLGVDDNIELKINIHITGGKIKLHKLDSDTKTNKTIGLSTLLNASYGIYDQENNLVEIITTNELGECVSDHLKFGKYYLKELNPSYGYELDDSIYEFVINLDNLDSTIEVYETLKKQDVIIVKSLEGDSNFLKGESNITFEIYFNDNMELYKTFTTNEDGIAKIKLPFGQYLFRQVNTTEGYLACDDFIVNVNHEKNEIYKLVNNKKVKGKLEIIKIDSQNEERLSNAFIEVYDDNNSLIYDGYTDDSGSIIIEDLMVGKYKIIESIAPNGYILNNEEYYVDISNNTPEIVLKIKNDHEEIEVPNTSLNGKKTVKLFSLTTLLIGLILIYISKKNIKSI